MSHLPWLCPSPLYASPHHFHRRSPHRAHRRRARWLHGRQPCCELCELALRHFPEMFYPGFASELAQFEPDFGGIMDMFQGLHAHYAYGLDDDPYTLSHELEMLSQWAWKVARSHPLELWPLRQWAEELKMMASEMQIGPRRLPFYTMPQTLALT
ncbi:hypothetical protein EJ04DRAFT_214072 [Polyplosphaeria fusca]|uniref:Uncharacterized protein n=1 Tax=Polyplosphaeria fusca TaxID=682080 RepID=A0A9P4V767_9PLEO|nr:hypothetical protein EJ04DRAFT_214072 [Polyplosphaeria fusca]